MNNRLPGSLPVTGTATYTLQAKEHLTVQLEYSPDWQLTELTLQGNQGTHVSLPLNVNALLELLKTAATAALADPGAIGRDAALANPSLADTIAAVAA